MKLPANKRLKIDKDGRARVVEQISPKLDASKKIAVRKSKKQKVVRRTP